MSPYGIKSRRWTLASQVTNNFLTFAIHSNFWATRYRLRTGVKFIDNFRKRYYLGKQPLISMFIVTYYHFMSRTNFVDLTRAVAISTKMRREVSSLNNNLWHLLINKILKSCSTYLNHLPATGKTWSCFETESRGLQSNDFSLKFFRLSFFWTYKLAYCQS